MEYTCPLFEQFKHYGLDYLIPQHFTRDDSDEEGIAHAFGSEGSCDPMEDAYYDRYFDDEECEEDDYREEDLDAQPLGDISIVWNFDSLLRLFNVDYLELDEFLSMNIWDLFEISKKQFDLIDWSRISSDDFVEFYEVFLEEDRPLPIEKKILYSHAQAITDYRKIAYYHGDDCTPDEMIDYCEHIVDTHSLDSLPDLFQRLFDYLRFFDDATEMNRRRAEAGEPTFKYVRKPKPSRIRDLHDKAFRDHQAMETERLSKDREKINTQIKWTSELPMYKKFLYSTDEYIVLPVTNQETLDYEGNYLHHCVASYGSYMAYGESYIYLIRKKDDQCIPFFTAEILPGEKANDPAKLNQCYTFDDSITKPESLKKFILEWSKATKFSIKCKI